MTPVTASGVDAAMARVAEIRQLMGSPAGAAGTQVQAAGASQSSQASWATAYSAAAPAARPAGAASVAGAGDGETAPSGVPVDRFARDLLSGIGAPLTSENMRAVRAWVQAEGTPAKFNPLATTKNMAGATAYNSVGVRNYTGYAQGLDATLKTITNGRYEPVLAAFRSGNDAMAVAGAIERSPWGTGGLVRTILSKEAAK